MGDLDDDTLSSATGTTVKGRGSPAALLTSRVWSQWYSRQQYNVNVSFCFRSVFMERFDRSTVRLSCVLRKRTKTYRCVGTEQFEGLWNDYALPNGLACTCSTRQDWEKMYSTYVKQRILYFERMGH